MGSWKLRNGGLDFVGGSENHVSTYFADSCSVPSLADENAWQEASGACVKLYGPQNLDKYFFW
jgi:hypothetical protein